MIAAAGADALRGIGLTRAKATAIARLAETLASGRLDCARLADLPSDDAQAALVALPGIGPWTASYVRMRVLGDRDAFPAADLGVIKALEALGIARADQVATAERWRPWRAYAVLHLWESLRIPDRIAAYLESRPKREEPRCRAKRPSRSLRRSRRRIWENGGGCVSVVC